MTTKELNIREFLEENPDYIDVLEQVLDHEQSLDREDFEGNSIAEKAENGVYWSSSDIPVSGQRLYYLWTEGLLDRVYNSNNYTNYALSVDRQELRKEINNVKSMFEGDTKVVRHDPASEEEIDGIFDYIVGYEDVKWLFKKALTQDDRVNIILYGPPGSGKTMFLRAVASLEGGHMINARSTEAGITADMFNHKPRFLCIDELDDMGSDDQRSLSDFTEDGVIKETKGNNKSRSMEINTKTFASANNPNDVEDQINNRFTDIHFEKYNLDEFIEICRRLLPKEYDVTEDHAAEIAEAVWDMDNQANVRKAEDVAALSDGTDPKRVLGVLEDYSP